LIFCLIGKKIFLNQIKIKLERQILTLMSFIKSLKQTFRASRQRRWNRQYDRSHITRVEKGLQVLASQGRPLSAMDARKSEEYAQEVLGSVDFAPWLKLYSAYRGEFFEGWIPDNYLGRVICPSINGDLRGLSLYKTLSKRLLRTDALPDIAYRIKGTWLSEDRSGTTLSEVKSACFDRYPYVFLKKNFSFQGNGIVKLSAEAFSSFDFGQVGDFVIQAPIFQHSFLEEISPGAVATLRITTVKAFQKRAETKLCGLRIGRKGMEYIETKGAIRIPVWPEDGKLYPLAITSDWHNLESHPDTGVAFEGKTIPFFKEATQLCESLHDRFPHIQLIGWDAAITQDGAVKLMEWNTDEPGIVYSESSIGPHFKGLGWENLWKK